MNQNLLQKIRTLHQLYHSGQIPTLAEHEVHPGLPRDSRENYLYFTLPPCLNFQRNSPAMWRAALATWEDTSTQYLFFPEQVVTTPLEEVQADLCKHKLGLQPNKHTEIWIKISDTLHKQFENDPRKIIEAGEHDAAQILHLIQKTHKPSFPYLSGPKMANYWLYILSQFTDIKLSNMNAISIIPDTHVLQCSIHLGIASPNDSSLHVAEAWKTLLTDTELSPIDMHPVLWNWSRNGFLPEVS